MKSKKDLLVFVQMMPVYPKTKTIPYLKKFLNLSYQRIYNMVNRFSYEEGLLAEAPDNGLCFVSEEAKRKARELVLSGKEIWR